MNDKLKIVELNNDFYSRAEKFIGKPMPKNNVDIDALVSDAIFNWLPCAINSGSEDEVNACIETCQMLNDRFIDGTTSRDGVIQEFWNRL